VNRLGPLLRIVRDQDRINELTLEALRLANNNAEAWKARCLLLYELADPSQRDEVLKMQGQLESLPEVLE
jgi:hypothetical protein